MILDNIPYVKYLKYAALAALVLALVVQTIRVAHRDTTIADKNTVITGWQSNCTAQATEINLLKSSELAANATITGLQGQLAAKEESIAQYRASMAEQQAIIASAHSVPAEPLQKTGEVIDNETSRKIVHFLNAVFARVGVFSENATDDGH